MELEDYFDFETEPVERIRFKGRRIDLDHVVDLYREGMRPEEIAVFFACPLELEQVYAAIAYYLHSKCEIDAYLERRNAIADANYQAYLAKGPSELHLRLLAAKAEWELSTARDADVCLIKTGRE